MVDQYPAAPAIHSKLRQHHIAGHRELELPACGATRVRADRVPAVDIEGRPLHVFKDKV